jgi:hypothetical protein
MGSLSGESNCFRDVVFYPSERSHHSFGNEGSSVSFFSFQTLSGVPIYCLGNRKHNSGSLPEESGRNTLLLSVSAGQGCSDPMLSIRLVMRHIPGRLNVLVDSLSRSLAPVNTEWELHQAVFQSIVLHWRNPNIDLFATSLNFKVTTFVSPVTDPRTYAVDAMGLSWEGMFAYAFPSFRYLAPVLHKITGEKCMIIVITPDWPKQAWFANLLCLSCARALVLP